MTTPALSAEWQDVANELCADPLGRALWERAQVTVLAKKQQERITQLEEALRAASAEAS